MKKNLYAVALLVLLGATVFSTRYYVCKSLTATQKEIVSAYALTQTGDYETANIKLTLACRDAQKRNIWLSFFIRRSLLDKTNETLATLPRYTQPDNEADLAVEISRAYAQLGQIKDLFITVF